MTCSRHCNLQCREWICCTLHTLLIWLDISCAPHSGYISPQTAAQVHHRPQLIHPLLHLTMTFNC